MSDTTAPGTRRCCVTSAPNYGLPNHFLAYFSVFKEALLRESAVTLSQPHIVVDRLFNTCYDTYCSHSRHNHRVRIRLSVFLYVAPCLSRKHIFYDYCVLNSFFTPHFDFIRILDNTLLRIRSTFPSLLLHSKTAAQTDI